MVENNKNLSCEIISLREIVKRMIQGGIIAESISVGNTVFKIGSAEFVANMDRLVFLNYLEMSSHFYD